MVSIKQSKSQVSTEFLIFIGVTVVLVFGIGRQQLSRMSELQSERESEMVYDMALKLQEEIRIASLVEEGYSRNFSIPSRLSELDYEVDISGKFLTVKSNRSFYTVKVPNITGEIIKGYNIITKSGGVVYIIQ